MRLVFMGTPEFAATILEDLIEQHEVVGVYTRPDAIRGRGKEKQASPVKLIAQEQGIKVYEPISLKSTEVQYELQALRPEAICVAAYGAILPQEVLEIPRYGCLNVHASLLPRWRGAAPVERAILADDEEVGVCIMRMETGLDTGDYCVCRTAYTEEKSAEVLSDELANLGSHALLTALIHVQEGVHDWLAQDSAQVTYAAKIEKGELDIQLDDTARQAVLKVHASSVAHPSRCIIAGRPLTLIQVQDIRDDEQAQKLTANMPRQSVRFAEKRLFLAMADGAFEVKMLKPDGKQEMSAQAFAAGIQGIKDKTILWEPARV